CSCSPLAGRSSGRSARVVVLYLNSLRLDRGRDTADGRASVSWSAEGERGAQPHRCQTGIPGIRIADVSRLPHASHQVCRLLFSGNTTSLERLNPFSLHTSFCAIVSVTHC